MLLIACSSNAVKGACSDDFSGKFLVRDWSGELPKTGFLERYKKGSGFRAAEDRLDEGLITEKVVSESGKPYLRVYFQTREILTTKADYRLVLDNRLEFRISEIVATGSGAWGCPLESARVNECQANANAVISFDRKCGSPVQK
ncbi:hypothetical protein [Niveibacterium sp. SC-1]|uniref:hypothetical protein n=1 Tax=Niveibacterium sp. SC-1 TaxID=3135646 RepID=UPI00311DDC89